jgi:hypothetical protein
VAAKHDDHRTADKVLRRHEYDVPRLATSFCSISVHNRVGYGQRLVAQKQIVDGDTSG